MNVLQTKIDSIKSGTNLNFISLTENATYKKISEEDLLTKGWLTNEDVYAVVHRLASLVASLPLTITNNGEPVDTSDEVYSWFFSEWNIKRDYNAEIYRIVQNILVYGRAYIYKRSEDIEMLPSELWTLNSKMVLPSQKKYSYFEKPEYYTLYNGSKSERLSPENLILIDNHNLENDYHTEYISPLQSVWNTVLSENNRSTAEKVLLENRGIAGFISPKGATGDASILGFTDKVIEKIRSAFATLTGGAEKFNKVEILEKASEFTQIGMSANDLKVVEMRLNHVRSICNAFGVPSLLFNDYQSRTHANYEEANRSLYTDAVLPLFDKIKESLQKEILAPYNSITGASYKLRVNKDEIEALNRNVANVLGSLSPLIANKFIENMTDEDIRALMLELGIVKQSTDNK